METGDLGSRIPHRTRAVRLALFFLVVLPLSACEEWRTRTSPTLKDLEECQSQYCERLIEVLNERIEWHVVMDISKSYLPSSESSLAQQKLRRVLGELPIIAGDSVCVDTFDNQYDPGICEFRVESEAQWRELRSSASIFAIYLQRRVETQEESRNFTDVATLLEALGEVGPRSSHEDEQRGPPSPKPSKKKAPGRQYFVVVTDGKHEPTVEPGHQQLFSEPRSPTYGSLAGISEYECEASAGRVHLHRGLLFLIDTGDLETRESNNVHKDWGRAAAYFRRLRRNLEDAGRHFFPVFTVVPQWDEVRLEGQLREQVDRRLGTYPCFVNPGWVEADRGEDVNRQWPTPHGYPLPPVDTLTEDCRFIAEGLPALNIPPKMFRDDGAVRALEISLYVLGREEANVYLRLESQSGEEDLGSPTKDRVENLQSPFEGWVMKTADMELEFVEGGLNTHDLPVAAKLEIEGRQGKEEFLGFTILNPTVLLGQEQRLQEKPGVLAWVMACLGFLLFIVTSWFLGRREVDLCVTFVKERAHAGKDKKKVALESLANVNAKGVRPEGLRCKFDGRNGCLVEGNPPDRGFPKHAARLPGLRFDLLHIGFRLVFILWRRQGGKRNFEIESGGSALVVTRGTMDGVMVSPQTLWYREPRRPKNRLKGRLSAEYCWGEPLLIKLRDLEGVRGLEVRMAVDWSTRFLQGLVRSLFAVTAGASLVTLYQVTVVTGNVTSKETGKWLLTVWGGLVIWRAVDVWILRRCRVVRRVLAGVYWLAGLCFWWFFLGATLFVLNPRAPWLVDAFFLGFGVLLCVFLILPHILKGRLAEGKSIRPADVLADSISFLFPVIGNG